MAYTCTRVHTLRLYARHARHARWCALQPAFARLDPFTGERRSGGAAADGRWAATMAQPEEQGGGWMSRRGAAHRHGSVDVLTAVCACPSCSRVSFRLVTTVCMPEWLQFSTLIAIADLPVCGLPPGMLQTTTLVSWTRLRLISPLCQPRYLWVVGRYCHQRSR
jgi:hypothetical protein